MVREGGGGEGRGGEGGGGEGEEVGGGGEGEEVVRGERYIRCTHLQLLLGLLETQGGQEAHSFPFVPVDLQVLLPLETPCVRGSHSVL